MSSYTSFGGTGQQLLKRDLELAVNLILVEFRESVWEHDEHMNLVELVLDYGRKPIARFPSGDFILSERLVTEEDLAEAVLSVGRFDDSNRAGIEGTLHRISCIRDREDNIYGLTIRVGRALITETAALVEGPLKGVESILIIGPPGVGKTSAIRNFCRVLSEDCKKRVMIVDTSNEIGGPGRVPHHAVGSCRRMQVKQRSEQHNVLIEAVQNHMPETEECQAIRSIAQRGVQLFATTHGHTLERMIKDRVLRELVGGINDVTIGDIRAKELGKDKKTVLERVEASCFDVIVEMAERTHWRIHYNANKAVDAILKGSSPNAETRYLDEIGNMVVKGEDETRVCQGAASVENNAPDNTLIVNSQVWDPDSQVQDDWGGDSSTAIIDDTKDSTVGDCQPEQKDNKEANPVKSLAEEEATRILNASSDLEVLKVKDTASEEKLKERFKAVFQNIEKTQNEDKIVAEARSRAQRAYQALINHHRRNLIVQAEKEMKEKEARRILLASSEMEVLQVKSSASKEQIEQCFKTVRGRIAKSNGEEQIVSLAKDRLNKAYQELLAEHQRREAQPQILKKAILKEARRIMNSSIDLEVLQLKHDASRAEIRHRFTELNKKLPKTVNEEETVTEARALVEESYEELMDWLVCENVNTLKEARLKEAKRIINSSSDLKVLQVSSNSSLAELKESFNYISMTIQKYPDEKAALQKARTRLQSAYNRLRKSRS